jgi:hypothetical protein
MLDSARRRRRNGLGAASWFPEPIMWPDAVKGRRFRSVALQEDARQ